MGELKSTNLFQAGGHHELKYGWRLEYSEFDQDRYYSGPLGLRALEILAPNGGGPAGLPDPNFSTYSFFTLQPGQYPSDFGPGAPHPFTDLLQPPIYQDHLKANVSALSNAFFLQDSYSPSGAAQPDRERRRPPRAAEDVRHHGKAFLDTDNLGPRLGVIYDPGATAGRRSRSPTASYYEAIPMNLAARYFGGEGILTRYGVPIAGNCARGVAEPEPLHQRAAESERLDRQRRVEPVLPPPVGSTADPGRADRPLQQRQRLPRAGQPPRPVPQRDRRHGRARAHGGPGPSARLPAPLDWARSSRTAPPTRAGASPSSWQTPATSPSRRSIRPRTR